MTSRNPEEHDGALRIGVLAREPELEHSALGFTESTA
jgi:hypothetical protein